ncbi:MAG: hypothetical protein JWQ10_1702, partial [Herbaspirillum sp.]|nr:hypothetical protein [Herbaspirillum sp.]
MTGKFAPRSIWLKYLVYRKQ